MTDRVKGIVAYVRRHPGLRRALFWMWALAWVIGTLAVLEVVSRWWLVPWHQEVGNRHMQPYFMTGGYYQTPLPGVRPENVLLGPGGPETYGYRREGGTYVFGFDRPVRSVAERGTFLFQDQLARADAAPQPNVRRVFVLGGSAAYGVGASRRDARWYAVLERSLTDALQQDVQVIPAAMVGHMSVQERLAMELMVLPRAPDAIIILDGWNDVALPSMFGVRPGDPYDQGMLYAEFYHPLGGVRKWLARHSQLARYLVQRSIASAVAAQQAAVLASPDRVAAYADSTSSVYLDNITRMLDRCRDEQVPCMAFLQPARDVVSGQPPSEQNALVVASYDRIRRRLREIASGGSIQDLSELLPADGQLFVDKVHFTDAGHAAVARAMHPWVLGLLRQ